MTIPVAGPFAGEPKAAQLLQLGVEQAEPLIAAPRRLSLEEVTAGISEFRAVCSRSPTRHFLPVLVVIHAARRVPWERLESRAARRFMASSRGISASI